MCNSDDDVFSFLPYFTNIPTRWSCGFNKNHIGGGFGHDIIRAGYLMEVLITWTSIKTSLNSTSD